MNPKTQTRYSLEHRDDATRMVFEAREPDEPLKTVCFRLAPALNVKPLTLYGWCKKATPTTAVSARKAGTVGELEAEVRSLRKELRETKRANEILKAAATFFGAEIDRQSQR